MRLSRRSPSRRMRRLSPNLRLRLTSPSSSSLRLGAMAPRVTPSTPVPIWRMLLIPMSLSLPMTTSLQSKTPLSPLPERIGRGGFRRRCDADVHHARGGELGRSFRYRGHARAAGRNGRLAYGRGQPCRPRPSPACDQRPQHRIGAQAPHARDRQPRIPVRPSRSVGDPGGSFRRSHGCARSLRSFCDGPRSRRAGC